MTIDDLKRCEHGVAITAPRATKRAAECLLCHAAYLADAAKRSAARREAFTPEERDAFAEYYRQWKDNNRDHFNARRRLWRAERRLIAAFGTGDEVAIQKRRLELAQANELIHVFGAWSLTALSRSRPVATTRRGQWRER